MYETMRTETEVCGQVIQTLKESSILGVVQRDLKLNKAMYCQIEMLIKRGNTPKLIPNIKL